MILGIVGTAVAVFFTPVGIILGTIAIVLGATGRSEAKARGMTNVGQATAGLVLGIVAIVLAIAWIALIAVIHSS